MIRLFVCFSLILASQFSFADAEAEINYRKAVMKVVGGHMGGIAGILRGGVHSEELAYHAKGMPTLPRLYRAYFLKVAETVKPTRYPPSGKMTRHLK